MLSSYFLLHRTDPEEIFFSEVNIIWQECSNITNSMSKGEEGEERSEEEELETEGHGE